MAEFKVRNGEAFESLIKQKQRDNPKFSFLFDTASPAHAYYQYKVSQVAVRTAVAPSTARCLMVVVLRRRCSRRYPNQQCRRKRWVPVTPCSHLLGRRDFPRNKLPQRRGSRQLA